MGEKIVEDGDEKVFVERLDDVNTANSHTWLRLAPLNREPPSSFSMVRKLKYHEQKLLKKVDFLNVSFSDATWALLIVYSGSKMQIYGKSKSCVDTIFRTAKITISDYLPCLDNVYFYAYTLCTGITSYVVRYDSMRTECLFCLPRTPSEVGWRLSFCQNSTIWVS